MNDTLTTRQREVLIYITLGIPNKDIARRLSIEEGTISGHVKEIYKKLGVHTRAQLGAYAALGHIPTEEYLRSRWLAERAGIR